MRTVEWHNGYVKMVDQRKLPWELAFEEYERYQDVAQAITDMVVRGAPAIGASAAFGMALAAQGSGASDVTALRAELNEAAAYLKAARPTAVNLAWAVDKLMREASRPELGTVAEVRDAMLQCAQQLADADIEINKRLGGYGSQLIKNGDVVLHHCNTGALATVDYGTALGVIRSAHEDRKQFHVLLAETRPRMQGARLSAWELDQLGIPYEIIPDTAVGHFMQKGEIRACFVGADRIAANGDVANKIGTYQIAVLAREHWLPFYVIAPTSTIDLRTLSGAEIPIEERSPDEVRTPYGHKLVPDHFPVRNPAFDITPNAYVTGIVTEHGLVKAPYVNNLPKIM
jgi:methylthioribose-1-phosphate isomerase